MNFLYHLFYHNLIFVIPFIIFIIFLILLILQHINIFDNLRIKNIEKKNNKLANFYLNLSCTEFFTCICTMISCILIIIFLIYILSIDLNLMINNNMYIDKKLESAYNYYNEMIEYDAVDSFDKLQDINEYNNTLEKTKKLYENIWIGAYFRHYKDYEMLDFEKALESFNKNNKK